MHRLNFFLHEAMVPRLSPFFFFHFRVKEYFGSRIRARSKSFDLIEVSGQSQQVNARFWLWAKGKLNGYIDLVK